MFDKKSCFAPKLFKQKPCFAPQITVELASWELPSFAVVRASEASTFFEASIPSTKTAKFGRKLVSLL